MAYGDTTVTPQRTLMTCRVREGLRIHKGERVALLEEKPPTVEAAVPFYHVFGVATQDSVIPAGGGDGHVCVEVFDDPSRGFGVGDRVQYEEHEHFANTTGDIITFETWSPYVEIMNSTTRLVETVRREQISAVE